MKIDKDILEQLIIKSPIKTINELSKEFNIKADVIRNKFYRIGVKAKKAEILGWGKGDKNISKRKDVREKISKNHIGKKKSEETKRKMSLGRTGSKNGAWNNGSSLRGYSVDWTKTLKISIRERDHYQCQICGKNQGDKVHAVHHIDYNKKNCNPNNLITLCIKCHAKTNRKRDYWKNIFNTII